jgi:hypothetical protein
MTMARTQRTRYLLVGTLIALGVLVADQLVLTPLLAKRAAAKAKLQDLQARHGRAMELLTSGQQMDARWRELLRTGMKQDPDAAESQVMHALYDWKDETGVALSLMKPDRLADKTRLPEIVFHATGTGRMAGVARLLWLVQASGIPVKVIEAQISARKEGADDLSFQLRLSTVYAPGRAEPPRPASAASASATDPAVRSPQGGRR